MAPRRLWTELGEAGNNDVCPDCASVYVMSGEAEYSSQLNEKAARAHLNEQIQGRRAAEARVRGAEQDSARASPESQRRQRGRASIEH
jgi:hypothetical protein